MLKPATVPELFSRDAAANPSRMGGPCPPTYRLLLARMRSIRFRIVSSSDGSSSMGPRSVSSARYILPLPSAIGRHPTCSCTSPILPCRRGDTRLYWSASGGANLRECPLYGMAAPPTEAPGSSETPNPKPQPLR
ncbi:hypothetical protein DIPPA_09037 [Diplonema papillatum]|nr:hypothetical protein DIPPA_09037 [Diplonema papillatum]